VLSIIGAANLKWLQTFSAGVDSPFFIQLMERGVTLSNASGASGSPIAQTAILYMLALSRDMRSWMRKQDRREWQQHRFDELDGASLAVIGMGPIGSEVARIAGAMGMKVEAVRRSARGDEPCPVFGFDELHAVLGRADWVVSALPLAPETRNIFGAQAFAAMRDGARFINVGRGELVDEDSLVEALRSGKLSGAALDVFVTEPLPVESPLWDMENVIITPHNSGSSRSTGARSQRIFVDNLARWSRGERLHNQVN
jgi:phosphoglycerate dehydrogenase-like enzyme